MHDKKTLLLVEDDLELALLIEQFLQSEDYRVEVANDGEIACQIIDEKSFDLIILDLMLPKKDGLEVCRHLRKINATPVLMLTAKDDEMIEMASLKLGVDNYLKKPVRPHLLLAHIEAMLRRADYSASEPIASPLTLSTENFTAALQGETLDLTSGEFQLLHYLYQRAGQIISREQLYVDIRGIPYDGIDRSIDLRISVLRKKMNDDHPPYQFIKTIRGKGYLLALS